MDPKHIPEAGVARLSLYLRELDRLERGGTAFVSSRALAQSLNLSDAQIRRDLSYFGQFGRSGRGYEVRRLRAIIPEILGLKGRTWRAAVVGVGNLGSALLAYGGFQERGFVMTAAYDADPRKVGRTIAGITVESCDQLEPSVQQRRVHIGIIAVPVAAAQPICDRLVRAGVKAILNFAPVRLTTEPGVALRYVDLSIELESLAYRLSSVNGRRSSTRFARSGRVNRAG